MNKLFTAYLCPETNTKKLFSKEESCSCEVIYSYKYINENCVFTIITKEAVVERVINLECIEFFENNDDIFAIVNIGDIQELKVYVDIIAFYQMKFSMKFSSLELPNVKTPSEQVEMRKKQIVEIKHILKRIQEYKKLLNKSAECLKTVDFSKMDVEFEGICYTLQQKLDKLEFEVEAFENLD